MMLLNIFKAMLRALLWRDATLKDIEEEMRSHVEMEIETNIERGMRPDEARLAAMRSFGNLGRLRDLAYDVRGGGMVETLWQDLRCGSRMLLKHPSFTFIAVLTLALGIGANTAIFSVLNSVLLRPLPYEAADRLVWIWDSNPSLDYPRFPSSGLNFKDWQQESESFEHMSAFTGWSFNLTNEGEPERIQGAMASSDFFPMLGIKPVMGRVFLLEEEKAGSHRVALISYSLWQRRFASDPDIINRSITLNGESYSVIGIVPADFRTLYPAEIWTPLALDVLKPGRGSHYISVIARLKPGTSIEQAQAEMNGITTRLQQRYPGSNTGWSTVLQPLHERVVGSIKPVLWTMLGAVCLVLLIACANVANLMMARHIAAKRDRDSYRARCGSLAIGSTVSH
jgi:putative ABC transport system permease protein